MLSNCEINECPIHEIPDDFFGRFDIVMASRLGISQSERIGRATTKSGECFYLVETFGWNGCAVSDLGSDFRFRKEIGKDKLSDPQKKSKPYLTVEEIWQRPLGEAGDRWHKIPSQIWVEYRLMLEYERERGAWPTGECRTDFAKFSQYWCEKGLLEKYYCQDVEERLLALADLVTAEVSPVCAVLGGVLGNEIIKALSGKGEPAENACFSMVWMEGVRPLL